MKIDWDKYKQIVSSIASTEMESIIHNMVRMYLESTPTENTMNELRNMHILCDELTEEKKIVKPFNFMDDDRS